LSPAIAIEQKALSKNPRSTVGTVTEVLDYLRVLFSRAGIQHCPECGRAVEPASPQQIARLLAELPPATRFQLIAPLARNQKGDHTDRLEQALHEGFSRARVDGQLVELHERVSWPKLRKNEAHTIEIMVDRLQAPLLRQEKKN
jgi:excinuclease ABC subunit A